jgi:ABC-type nitrate/sulfonate/bicarbonate transport system substrate-binding protein
LFRKATIAANPKLAEQLMKAHAEAIKRFYDDKAFAVKAYMMYDKQDQADVEHVYDAYAKVNNHERVPYIPPAAVQYVLDHPADENLATPMKTFDFRKVIDNSLVDRLVREGFFEKLFGPRSKPKRSGRRS